MGPIVWRLITRAVLLLWAYVTAYLNTISYFVVLTLDIISLGYVSFVNGCYLYMYQLIVVVVRVKL